MDKNTANTSIKNLWSEAFNLSPSVLITLFEIDIGQIGLNRGLISFAEVTSQVNTIFRFHNNVKLTTNSIWWQGKEFIAIPINAEGFETNSKGTLPSPKISLTVPDESVSYLALLKDKIYELGDLTGAKVTRIRTHAKFLDAINFFDGIPPAGFIPDPNSEYPRDIYFIDRKSLENKNIIEFELNSLFDLSGFKLPGRLVTSNSCTAQYRGGGCLYEFSARRNTKEHGEINESILPEFAPPIANDKNEFITDLLGGSTSLIDKGEYINGETYNKGDYVYIEHNNIKYYFIANQDNVSIAPPNLKYWIADQCSKQNLGCAIRWGEFGSANGPGVIKGQLPFNAFPACNRFK